MRLADVELAAAAFREAVFSERGESTLREKISVTATRACCREAVRRYRAARVPQEESQSEVRPVGRLFQLGQIRGNPSSTEAAMR